MKIDENWSATFELDEMLKSTPIFLHFGTDFPLNFGAFSYKKSILTKKCVCVFASCIINVVNYSCHFLLSAHALIFFSFSIFTLLFISRALFY